jgi:hypothetical protein
MLGLQFAGVSYITSRSFFIIFFFERSVGIKDHDKILFHS